MSIVKNTTTAEGVQLAFHKVVQVAWNSSSDGAEVCLASIRSWPTQSACESGAAPTQSTAVRVVDRPYPTASASMFEAAERLLILDKESALYGGTYSAPQAPSNELTRAKLARWSHIKACRAAAISQDLTTPYGVFQCGPTERTNITDAVLLLQTLTAMGTPTTINFTLADDSTVNLDATAMITVGLLLGQKVQAAHATARLLRSSIFNATSVGAVAELAWPAT